MSEKNSSSGGIGVFGLLGVAYRRNRPHYKGQVFASVWNRNNEPWTPFLITPGERIAQMVIAPVWMGEFSEIEELSETERGAGGFGSTGK